MIFTSVLQRFSYYLRLLGMSCNWEELQGGAVLVLQLAALQWEKLPVETSLSW